jgi:hypothetical protein
LEDLDKIANWKNEFDELWRGFMRAIRSGDAGKPWNRFLREAEMELRALQILYVYRNGAWGDLGKSEYAEADT